MKALAVAIGIAALSLGLVAGVVFGLGDDSVLVSPPEVVAEEYVRALALGRVGPAREMLARDAEPRTSKSDVQRLAAAIQARIGRAEQFEGRVARRNRDTATVRLLVQGERGDVDIDVAIVREYGQWSVAEVREPQNTGDSSRGTATRR